MRTVTHYIPREIEPGNWIPLVFITTDGDEYYFGFEERPSTSWIKKSAEMGGIECIPENNDETYYQIEDGQSVWMDHQGSVWIVDRSNPIDGPKTLIVFPPLS